MLISPKLAKAFNEQIGHEFGASLQYIAIAAHFYQRSLTLMAKLFGDQAEEEKQHAMKFVKYLQDTSGGLQIPVDPRANAHVHLGRRSRAGRVELGEGTSPSRSRR